MWMFSWVWDVLGALGAPQSSLAPRRPGLPAAGRAGSWAVCAAFLALGLVQGPYIAAMAVLQNSIMPAAASPAASERPLAQMIIRLGQQAAKLAAAVVPWVAGRWGWAVFRVRSGWGRC